MCLLGIAPILHAVDRDIDAWFSVRPMPAHLDGDFAYASERPEVKTDADNIAAQIMDMSLKLGAPWASGDASIVLSRADLEFSQPITLRDGRVIDNHLIYNEAEVVIREFPGQFMSLGFDLDLVHYSASRELAWRETEITGTAFAHFGIQNSSSWIISMTYASQPNWGLPRFLPGIAYCLHAGELTAIIGFPYTSIHWQPYADLAFSVSIADEAKATVALTHAELSMELTYVYSPRYFGLHDAHQSEPILYAESTVSVTVFVVAPAGVEWSLGIGRVLTRMIGIDGNDPDARSLGGAWIATAEMEFHF